MQDDEVGDVVKRLPNSACGSKGHVHEHLKEQCFEEVRCGGVAGHEQDTWWRKAQGETE